MAEARLIDANALLGLFDERLDGAHIQVATRRAGKILWTGIHGGVNWGRNTIIEAPTIDPESLMPKGSWNIRCESHRDNYTGEVDEEFYLECSECKRTVWNIDQMCAMSGNYRKLIEAYPYCHCGAKMEG